MKKWYVAAAGLMFIGMAATTASAALENEFGGYWRSRFLYMDNFDGKDSDSVFYVDQRTQLFYTAKFSENFKFVNKFEFNSGWGDTTNKNAAAAGLGAGGDLGADGKGNFRIKNSYADFNIGQKMNAKVGIQGFTISRGFIFDDDASGITLTGNFGNITVPLVWMVLDDNDVAGWDVATASNQNQNLFAALAAAKVNDAMTFTPFFVYHIINDSALVQDSKNWYLGVDADLKFGDVTVWGTAIYNGGQIDDIDNKAYLGAVGVDAGLVHGQFFYASGDDGKDATENTAFTPAPGRSYYWSEIMGLGVFDDYVSNGSPGDGISNVWAANAGVTIKPIDKLQIDADLWYAALAEDNTAGDKELGWEIDGKIGYTLYENLTAEAIAAYLISGEATGDENVMEAGVRLSLKF